LKLNFVYFIFTDSESMGVLASPCVVTLIQNVFLFGLASVCLLVMTCTKKVWKFCTYSLFFPLGCFANHALYIITASLHNLRHAINMAAIYTLVGIFLSAMMTLVSHQVTNNIHRNNRHPLLAHLAVKLIVVTTLCGYVGGVALFFTFVPTRLTTPLSYAPNFFSVAVIAAMVVIVSYFWITYEHRSFLWVLAEAETQRRRRNKSNSSWFRKTLREQELALARALLVKLFPPDADKGSEGGAAASPDQDHGGPDQEHGRPGQDHGRPGQEHGGPSQDHGGQQLEETRFQEESEDSQTAPSFALHEIKPLQRNKVT